MKIEDERKMCDVKICTRETHMDESLFKLCGHVGRKAMVGWLKISQALNVALWLL